jgi:hypothetical protein
MDHKLSSFPVHEAVENFVDMYPFPASLSILSACPGTNMSCESRAVPDPAIFARLLVSPPTRAKTANCWVFWPVPPIQLDVVASVLPSSTPRPRSLHPHRRSPALVASSAITLAISPLSTSRRRDAHFVTKATQTPSRSRTGKAIRGSEGRLGEQ